jgi:BMFP domain-containing protein YqiC
MDPKLLDDLAQKLAHSVPESLQDLQRDVQKNARAALESTFAKLNLVSREEFDVQSAVLARTRAKVEQLEKTIAVLESRVLKKKTEK